MNWAFHKPQWDFVAHSRPVLCYGTLPRGREAALANGWKLKTPFLFYPKGFFVLSKGICSRNLVVVEIAPESFTRRSPACRSCQRLLLPSSLPFIGLLHNHRLHDVFLGSSLLEALMHFSP
jgi:hypothetical protein